jgi:hypothetical protein
MTFRCVPIKGRTVPPVPLKSFHFNFPENSNPTSPPFLNKHEVRFSVAGEASPLHLLTRKKAKEKRTLV